MNKIKVLQVNKLYYPVTGGIERVVQQIAEGLNEHVDMKVLVCKEKGKTVKEQINGVNITRASSLGVLFSVPLSLSFFVHLRRMSKDRDVVHFHVPFPLGDLACLLSGYKGKVVVWWHSDVVKQKKLMLLYKPIMKRFLKRADVIVVATQGHIDGSEYLKDYREKCLIIPYGVDREIERNGDLYYEKTHGVTLKNKDESKRLSFLFVGRLVYYKGCKILVEAFSKVEGANLNIIGSGPLEAELKHLVQKNGIGDRVQFLGNATDEQLNKNMESCDVFVLPSIARSEAFGLVQIEAMCYGKPVINTNLPSGVPYVSIHQETGLTVKVDDVPALAEAMKWMVEHDEERVAMGIRAKQRVKECFQMDDMLKKVYNVYSQDK